MPPPTAIPHPDAAAAMQDLPSPEQQSASPCILSALLELVEAGVSATHKACGSVAQLQLLYPLDATTRDMVVAHSSGLRLFERLHALLESCKALLQRRWDDAVLQPVVVGMQQGRGAAATSKPGSFGRSGSAAAALEVDAAVEEAGHGRGRGAEEEEPAARSRSQPRSSLKGSDGGGERRSSFTDKVKHIVGRLSGQGSAANKVFPGTGRLGSGDGPLDGDDHASVAASGSHVSHLNVGPAGVAPSLQRRLALQLTWQQLAVLERLRTLLVSLRCAMEGGRRPASVYVKARSLHTHTHTHTHTDTHRYIHTHTLFCALSSVRLSVSMIGHKLTEAFLKSARGCYHQQSPERWASKSAPSAPTEGEIRILQ